QRPGAAPVFIPLSQALGEDDDRGRVHWCGGSHDRPSSAAGLRGTAVHQITLDAEGAVRIVVDAPIAAVETVGMRTGIARIVKVPSGHCAVTCGSDEPVDLAIFQGRVQSRCGHERRVVFTQIFKDCEYVIPKSLSW